MSWVMEELEILYRMRQSIFERVARGDERARPILTALDEMIVERELIDLDGPGPLWPDSNEPG